MIAIATLLFALYTAVSIAMFGIPSSLSMTHYLWHSAYKHGKVVFPAFMVTFVALILPSMLKVTEGSQWQFSGFLLMAALLFVAFAPWFLSDAQRQVHITAAIVAATLAAAFTLAFGKWWVLASALAICGALAISNKRCAIFYLELAAFISVLITLNTMR